MRTTFKKILAAVMLTAAFHSVQAQTTCREMEQLTVNEQVTTVITASENQTVTSLYHKSAKLFAGINVRFVDYGT